VLRFERALALIEGAQGQQTGTAGDLAAGKVGADGFKGSRMQCPQE
jgi:hypothetical protein